MTSDVRRTGIPYYTLDKQDGWGIMGITTNGGLFYVARGTARTNN